MDNTIPKDKPLTPKEIRKRSFKLAKPYLEKVNLELVQGHRSFLNIPQGYIPALAHWLRKAGWLVKPYDSFLSVTDPPAKGKKSKKKKI